MAARIVACPVRPSPRPMHLLIHKGAVRVVLTQQVLVRAPRIAQEHRVGVLGGGARWANGAVMVEAEGGGRSKARPSWRPNALSVL
jgi:hypothetical protein